MTIAMKKSSADGVMYSSRKMIVDKVNPFDYDIWALAWSSRLNDKFLELLNINNKEKFVYLHAEKD